VYYPKKSKRNLLGFKVNVSEQAKIVVWKQMEVKRALVLFIL
jgi:hypothetical protein